LGCGDELGMMMRFMNDVEGIAMIYFIMQRDLNLSNSETGSYNWMGGNLSCGLFAASFALWLFGAALGRSSILVSGYSS
jgi:hypothetical protein